MRALVVLMIGISASTAFADVKRARSRGETLRAGSSPVAVVSANDGVWAESLDGLVREKLVAGKARAQWDATRDLLWYAQSSGLWVLDLAAANKKPIHIATKAGEWKVTWSKRPEVTGLAAGAKLVGRTWLAAQASRSARAARPPINVSPDRHVDLDKSMECEAADHKLCGASAPLGATGLVLVIVDHHGTSVANEEGGRDGICFLTVALHDPSRKKWFVPDRVEQAYAGAGADTSDAWNLALSSDGKAWALDASLCTTAGCRDVGRARGATVLGWLDPGAVVTTGDLSDRCSPY